MTATTADRRCTTSTVPGPAIDPVAVARHERELREEGFTVFAEVMTATQLDALRAAIDSRLAVRGGERPEELYGEPNLVARAPIFRELAQQPLVLAVAERMLGDDCILSSCNLAARVPAGPPQNLHRDTGIWGRSLPWLDLPVGIQTAWCADDFTQRSGATRLVPRSHAVRDPSHEQAGVTVEAPAGSIIAFDARTLHAGGANRGDAIRRAVLTLYVRSWLKPQTDHKRSIDPAIVATSSPALVRLLGFERQSPIEHADGRSEIVPAPGATWFYGQVDSGG